MISSQHTYSKSFLQLWLLLREISITTVTNSMSLCIAWHIRLPHLLWIYYRELKGILYSCWLAFVLSAFWTQWRLTEHPVGIKRERGAYRNAMIENIFSELCWWYMILFILPQKVDNVFLMSHFVCDELMNLEEEDASVPAVQHKKMWLFFPACAMSWFAPCLIHE